MVTQRPLSFLFLPFVILSLALSCTGNEPNGDEKLDLNDDDQEKSRMENAMDERFEKFAMEAASDGMMEIRMAEVALRRSENQEVKDLAEMIKDDHQAANDRLREIADQNDWDLPDNMMDKHKDMVERLEDVDDASLNSEYLSMMEKGHQKAIAKFESMAGGPARLEKGNEPVKQSSRESGTPEKRNSNDQREEKLTRQPGHDSARATQAGVVAYHQDIQNWAENTLPVLKKHLEKTQELKARMK